ncbi:MAG: ABC transporter substrate-binding protein, partial [Leucobacter sp.]
MRVAAALESDLPQSPGFATAVNHPDPLSWVCMIREGVKFHDGTTMPPNDVVVSLSRNLDPEVASFCYDIFKNIDSIEQTGDHEVTVRTVVPDSQFNQLMSAAPAARAAGAADMSWLNCESGTTVRTVTSWSPVC